MLHLGTQLIFWAFFVLACSACHLKNVRWNAVNYSPNSGTEDWMLLPAGEFRPNAKWGLHIWLPLHLSYFSLSADENKTERLIVQRGKRLFHADWVILKTIYSLASREKIPSLDLTRGKESEVLGTWYIATYENWLLYLQVLRIVQFWKQISRPYLSRHIKQCNYLDLTIASNSESDCSRKGYDPSHP